MKTNEPPVEAPVAEDQHQSQIAASLRLSEAKLAGILASAMDAIITVDEGQRIVLFNAAAEKMFRCPAAEALGESLDLFIPERFRASHREHIRVFGETNVTQRAMGKLRSLFGLRSDGEEFPIEASISQIDAEGHKLFTAIIRDVTEKKRLESQFLRAQRIPTRPRWAADRPCRSCVSATPDRPVRRTNLCNPQYALRSPRSQGGETRRLANR